MNIVATKSMLQQIYADFEKRGWNPDDLRSFRMDGETDPPNPPAPPTGDTIVVEEPKPPAVEPTNNGDRTFSAEDIERARKEEKDKLYADLERERKAREAAEALVKEREEAEAEAKRKAAETRARKEAEEAEATRKAEEEELSAKELLEKRLTEQKQAFEERFKTIDAERAEERAIFEQERRFSAIQEHRAKLLESRSDEIMPELRDLVVGDTPEEIDASFDSLVERTNRILEQIRQQQQATFQRMPTASVTAPATGPTENEPGQRTFTADEIAAMPMSEYAKYRDSFMRSVSNRVQNRGLYG